MQTTERARTPRRIRQTHPSCGKLHRIETGQDIRTADDLAFLLRRARELRERDVAAFERVVEEILIRENYLVRQRVTAAGTRQSGSAWVERSAVDDVTGRVLMRIARFLGEMRGSSVGEFRNAVKTCIHFEVISYIRKDDRDNSVPVDPGHFTDALDPEEQEYSELAGRAAAGSAEDRAILRERLEAVLDLDDRAAEIVVLRGIDGLTAKEVAERLDISPANVDQIFSRATRKLRERDK